MKDTDDIKALRLCGFEKTNNFLEARPMVTKCGQNITNHTN